MDPTPLKGRVALVTGGASGLGAATASALLRAGAIVHVLDRATSNTVPAGVTFHKGDVTSEADVTAALTAIAGPLHIVVNSAGIARPARVANKRGSHKLALFQQVVGVNLVGTFNVMRLAAHHMIQHTPPATPPAATPAVAALGDKWRGVVVNLASVAAFDGEGGQVAYSASKAGVVGMTLPAARDLGRHGIRVVTVAPGLAKTPMSAGIPQEVEAAYAATVPFPRRLGHADDVAQAVLNVILSPYVNATTIRVDGGIRLSNL